MAPALTHFGDVHLEIPFSYIWFVTESALSDLWSARQPKLQPAILPDYVPKQAQGQQVVMLHADHHVDALLPVFLAEQPVRAFS